MTSLIHPCAFEKSRPRHFVIDAQGRLVSFEIAKSSAPPVLENEALALIQRAQLPALPPAFPTSTLDAAVPIRFFLNS